MRSRRRKRKGRMRRKRKKIIRKRGHVECCSSIKN
jgi:hypothetical protein